jgi:hypothetical protein
MPACTRIRAMQPTLVLVGRSVQPHDFVQLLRAADDVDAEVFSVDTLQAPGGLHEWVVAMTATLQTRRERKLARSA